MTPASRPRILVVDDEPLNQMILEGVLEENYDVTSCADGKSALQQALSVPTPDLILLDVMMPDLDGYQVCRCLKADPRTSSIPVIFVTALGDPEDESRGLAAGGVDFLLKPCHPAILKHRVQIHLALHNQNMALEARVRERTAELEQTRMEIVRRLGRAGEYRDNETGMHVMRMSHFCRRLALAIGIPEPQADLLLAAAPMHDIGKIGIPDNILLKPGRLTTEEREVMKRHAEIGGQIIGDDPGELLSLARVVALTHHERWDGTGYPNGVAGEAIPIYGRITAICDVFDALTSERPYKEAWPVDAAIAHLREEAGRAFDPALVDAFVELLPEIMEIAKRYQDTRPQSIAPHLLPIHA